MTIIKKQDIKKLSRDEALEKVKDLKIELMRERINSAKGGKVKIKEIKRTIARLLTFNRLKSVETK
jgi:ribosomal protein L29